MNRYTFKPAALVITARVPVMRRFFGVIHVPEVDVMSYALSGLGPTLTISLVSCDIPSICCSFVFGASQLLLDSFLLSYGEIAHRNILADAKSAMAFVDMVVKLM